MLNVLLNYLLHKSSMPTTNVSAPTQTDEAVPNSDYQQHVATVRIAVLPPTARMQVYGFAELKSRLEASAMMTSITLPGVCELRTEPTVHLSPSGVEVLVSIPLKLYRWSQQ